jgi:hypothetical protein
MVFFIGPFYLLIKVKNNRIECPPSMLWIREKQCLNTLIEGFSFKILNNFSNEDKNNPFNGMNLGMTKVITPQNIHHKSL